MLSSSLILWISHSWLHIEIAWAGREGVASPPWEVRNVGFTPPPLTHTNTEEAIEPEFPISWTKDLTTRILRKRWVSGTNTRLLKNHLVVHTERNNSDKEMVLNPSFIVVLEPGLQVGSLVCQRNRISDIASWWCFLMSPCVAYWLLSIPFLDT